MGERFLDTEEVGGSIPPAPILRVRIYLMTEISLQIEGKGPVTASPDESIGEVFRRSGIPGSVIGARGKERLFDLHMPVPAGESLKPVEPESPDGLEIIRHSTAHLMAQAVKRLFPTAQVTIGPVIEDGFFYDFSFERPFSPEDLEKDRKSVV